MTETRSNHEFISYESLYDGANTTTTKATS